MITNIIIDVTNSFKIVVTKTGNEHKRRQTTSKQPQTSTNNHKLPANNRNENKTK